MIRSSGHTRQSCCFPSSESPATPDSPTDSHVSIDTPATFTEQEDEFLRELVKRHGTKKWHIISAKMQNKTPRECRKRWRTYLHMCMNKSSWSEEEDRLLIEGHNAYGNRWTEIAKMVPGRTDNAVKNRYNALCKKRSNRSGKSVLSGMPALEISEEPDLAIVEMAKRGKKPKHREDGAGVFMPTICRTSCVKQGLSIEIPRDIDILRVEGNEKPPSLLSNSDPPLSKRSSSFTPAHKLTHTFIQGSSKIIPELPTIIIQMRDYPSGDSNSPRDGQVDMEEVMGWLLARTPTPTCNGSRNSNSTVTSSTSTTPSRPSENVSSTEQGSLSFLLKDPTKQLSRILKTTTSIRESVQC